MAIDKQVFRSGPYADFIAQAVRVDGVLYLSGQVGHQAEGQTADGLVAQTEVAYQNIAAVLAEFDAGMDNIVDETVFITDLADFAANAAALYRARTEAYGGNPDVCQTVIGVTGLIEPALKIEIKCIAHL